MTTTWELLVIRFWSRLALLGAALTVYAGGKTVKALGEAGQSHLRLVP